MSRLAKPILMFLLAVLPLRGYAGALMALCEGHHGGATIIQEHAPTYGDRHQDDSADGARTPEPAASVCSNCASCCAGGSLVPDTPQVAVFHAPGFDRVAFFDRRAAGFVPAQLDRPPLAS